MQKYLAILEDKVQWIAIGLGALFVLYMTYAFVLTPPAKVELGGQSLGPSEVDPYTVDHVAKQLEAEITRSGNLDIPIPDPKKSFVDAMEWKTARPVELSAAVWDSKTGDVQLPAAVAPVPTPNPDGTTTPILPAGGGAVAALPVLVAPTPAGSDENKFGRSVTLPATETGQAPPPPTIDQPVVGATDKSWVTQLFKINVGDIEKAFKDANIPAALANSTCFLQCEMERVEIGPDGKPIAGSETVVAPLGVWRQTPPPPFPADNADRMAQSQYLQWATANTPDILQPIFFTTVPNKGNQWTKPGQVITPDQVFDPATYTGALTVPPLTKEQLLAVQQYRREKYKAEQDAKKKTPAPRAPTPGGRGPGAFPGAEGVMDRSYAPAPAPPRRPGPGGRPPGFPRDVPPDIAMEGGFGGEYFPGAAAVPPGLPQPGVDYPAGDFDPADPKWKGKVIEAWAHDATVEPGKVYQYRLRYKIRNPIFGQPNAAAADHAALADVFALVSAWSGWSSPVTIPELVNFFVQSQKTQFQSTVRFDVFRWVEGQTRQETFTVAPGDQIGATKGDIDYSTNWTVVDFRLDERQNDWQIILVNNKDGSIAVRSYRADSNDALYKLLKGEIDAQKQLQQQQNVGGAGGLAPAIK